MYTQNTSRLTKNIIFMCLLEKEYKKLIFIFKMYMYIYFNSITLFDFFIFYLFLNYTKRILILKFNQTVEK